MKSQIRSISALAALALASHVSAATPAATPTASAPVAPAPAAAVSADIGSVVLPVNAIQIGASSTLNALVITVNPTVISAYTNASVGALFSSILKTQWVVAPGLAGDIPASTSPRQLFLPLDAPAANQILNLFLQARASENALRIGVTFSTTNYTQGHGYRLLDATILDK